MFSCRFLRTGLIACGNLKSIISSSQFESKYYVLQQGLRLQKDFTRTYAGGFRHRRDDKSRLAAIEDEDNEVEEDFEDDESGPKFTNLPKFNFSKRTTSDSAKLIDDLYERYPTLDVFTKSEMVAYLQRMAKCGIKLDKALEMLAIYPSAIGVRESSINAVLGTLRFFGLKEKQRIAALRRAPQLLEISPKRIAQSNEFLKTYFTNEETLLVITKSFDVFLQEPTTLKKKLDYLIKEMSHETKHIAICKVLAYPLRHMKTRHEFLVRAGLFKPIPYRRLLKVLEKEGRNKPRPKYFKPLEVVCYKDEDFLKACTNNMLSLNELAAFEEMYEAELNVLEKEEINEENTDYNNEDSDEENSNDAVSLVSENNSGGFMNDADAKYCYF